MPRPRPLAFALPLLYGCATTITPPVAPGDPAPVFVVDYGRHTSLVFRDDADPPLVEYIYGDWSWFALDRTAWHRVAPTLLWPTRGALGTRRLHAEPSAEALHRLLPCEEVLVVMVGARESTALADALHADFEAHADTAHYQPVHETTFVHDDAAYWLMHNCNHRIARWLRDLGCEVRGPAITADFVVREPGS